MPFTDEQKRAITGFRTVETITNLSRVRAPRFSATERCPEGLAPEQRYRPGEEPEGRAVHHLGSRRRTSTGAIPKTGFARRPLDNVGIQYGLDALNAGAITNEQFLDLNEKIGGFDIDGNVVARAHGRGSGRGARGVPHGPPEQAAAAASRRRRSSTTARTTTTCRAATSTCASTRSRPRARLREGERLLRTTT